MRNAMKENWGYVYVSVGGPTGQSSSVMLDQKIQTMITDSNVKRVSNKAPLTLPLVPRQM